tara:strand:+ start:732 stop:1238 length:507 start_codon:yes stop_codon:yes gene_type:complete
MTTAGPTVEIGILTKTDVLALRQCDRAAFETDRGSNQGRIRCLKELAAKGPFDETEREHTIACEAYGTVYGNTDAGENTTFQRSHRRAFSLQYNYIHTATTFGTFAALARAGDEIDLKWCGGGGNQYEKKAGLHRDSLTIEVKRGKHRYAFLIDVSVCLDNSARMVSR